MTGNWKQLIGLLMASIFASNYAQNYQEYADGYEQDNLYADYAMKQEQKERGYVCLLWYFCWCSENGFWKFMKGMKLWEVETDQSLKSRSPHWFVPTSTHPSQKFQFASEETVTDNLFHSYYFLLIYNFYQRLSGGGGGGMGKIFLCGGLGWFLGANVHSKRATKALKKKHMKETKTLYSQYYNDVYKLQEQNAELAYAVENLQKELQRVEQDREMEKIQRDYDEFKQPDVDGDDRISRAEFNMYVKNYLSNYPGLAEKDYPRFEDFDHDKDGFVSFQEYAQQMAVQVKQAEAEQKRAAQTNSGTQSANAKANALKGLSGQTKRVDNFNDLYAKYRG